VLAALGFSTLPQILTNKKAKKKAAYKVEFMFREIAIFSRVYYNNCSDDAKAINKDGKVLITYEKECFEYLEHPNISEKVNEILNNSEMFSSKLMNRIMRTCNSISNCYSGYQISTNDWGKMYTQIRDSINAINKGKGINDEIPKSIEYDENAKAMKRIYSIKKSGS